VWNVSTEIIQNVSLLCIFLLIFKTFEALFPELFSLTVATEVAISKEAASGQARLLQPYVSLDELLQLRTLTFL